MTAMSTLSAVFLLFGNLYLRKICTAILRNALRQDRTYQVCHRALRHKSAQTIQDVLLIRAGSSPAPLAKAQFVQAPYRVSCRRRARLLTRKACHSEGGTPQMALRVSQSAQRARKTPKVGGRMQQAKQASQHQKKPMAPKPQSPEAQRGGEPKSTGPEAQGPKGSKSKDTMTQSLKAQWPRDSKLRGPEGWGAKEQRTKGPEDRRIGGPESLKAIRPRDQRAKKRALSVRQGPNALLPKVIHDWKAFFANKRSDYA